MRVLPAILPHARDVSSDITGSVGIATVIGIFVTTWMTGKIAKMNAAAVFIALLFWSWLWGVWGMLLGIPIIFIAKVISQHVEQLHPVAELLGEQRASARPVQGELAGHAATGV
jgi:predicted PurR-regulated permease PerM